MTVFKRGLLCTGLDEKVGQILGLHFEHAPFIFAPAPKRASRKILRINAEQDLPFFSDGQGDNVSAGNFENRMG